ncbi:hypothetical protein PRIPAC_78773 [Pristionchus pacificus]|uniref:Uncharacterized protein n=1 Tax=Pristionchus pacificus TaxID=54126 RepID=A0A2A6BYX9_PRIPA|nr:hypothetical protein PRIPAC_78773 [Pristionchus pacificus]|eukprot:PDM71037.1 hypothetical protein PRIPAC_44433 [Pristionchus pacificus]
MMNSSDLLHNLREMEGSSTMGLKLSGEDGAYTFVQQRDVFLQLHTKKSEVYNSTIQVGISRIINTLGHEIGHHLTDHKQFIPTGRHLSDRFLRHLRNTLDCYRRVADEGLKIGPEAYSILNIPLLPNMTSMEEMYYRASTSSQFYCYNRELEDVIGFFTSTHPVQSQRVEYHRLFTKSPHFERTFNCTLKKSVCPNVF